MKVKSTSCTLVLQLLLPSSVQYSVSNILAKVWGDCPRAHASDVTKKTKVTEKHCDQLSCSMVDF